MSGSHWISEGGTTFFLAPTGGSSGSTKVTHSLTPPPAKDDPLIRVLLHIRSTQISYYPTNIAEVWFGI